MEARIYLEAEMMYKKIGEFSPVEGNLRKWVGHIKTRNNDLTLTVNVELPENYPQVPPIIRINPPVSHSIIDKDGKINIRLINFWQPQNHLYQVVNYLKAMFWKEEPIKLFTATIEKKKTQIKQKPKKIKKVKKQISKKEELEISRSEMEDKIRSQFSLDDVSLTLKDKVLDLQSEKLSIINLVESLDSVFQKGEVSPEIYSKLYKKYYDILVQINDELKEMKKN